MIAALLWPALWNGFPIVSDDTGGYLARPFEHALLFGRSAFYGAFLAAGIPLDFWPVVVTQGALIGWLVVLTLRTQGFGDRPSWALAAVIGLSALSGVPWFASQLVPDVLAPACALAIYLLAFRTRMIGRGERILLVVAVVISMASHLATLALALALLVFVALVRAFAARLDLPHPDLVVPAFATALGVLLCLLSNLAIAGRFAFTPGAANFEFARMVQSGIAARYLSEHCPDPTIRLCAFRGNLPATGDDWLWSDDSPLKQLGGAEGFAAEAQRIVWRSLLAYPGQHLASALISGADQFSRVGVGYAMYPKHWHARWTLERLAPSSVGPLGKSRVFTSGLDLRWLSILHAPIAGIAILILPVSLVMARRRRIRKASAALSLTMLVALLSNAAIVAMFANPADRYQSRLAPLALLAAGIAVLDWWERRSRAEPETDAVQEFRNAGLQHLAERLTGSHDGRHKEPAAQVEL